MENLKLEYLDLTSDPQKNNRLKKLSDSLDNYIKNVRPYIYTNIDFSHSEDQEFVIVSRIQQNLSNLLFRSIFLKDGIVTAFNHRNLVSLFVNLKLFMEIPAVLAYIYYLIEGESSYDDTLRALSNLAMGNKGEGTLRLGTANQVNILTMFGKLENFFSEVSNLSNSSTPLMKVMSDFYELVSNASHPNYDAHDITSTYDVKLGIWRGLAIDEFRSKIVTDLDWYSPPLIMTITCIEVLAQVIAGHPKIKNFSSLDNPLYFENI